MQFNPGNETGIVDEINDICGSDNNSYPLASKTRRVNSALDRFVTIVMQNDTNWTFDDSNNTDLPIGYANLVAGQQDYPLATEMLTVKSVYAKDQNGVYHRLEEDTAPNTLLTPSGNSGTPTRFKLIGVSILLDFIPNTTVVDGLKVEFGRNTTRFIVSDTTKEPGIPSLFHIWLAQHASLPHLMELQKAQRNDIAALVRQGEDSIREFFSTRNSTQESRMVPLNENNE